MSRRLTTAAVALGLSAALAACTVGPSSKSILADQAPAVTPTEQYGIKVTSAPEQIAIGLHAEGLSANQQAALSQFVSEWRENGGGGIVVRAPSDGADPRLARSVADATSAFLNHLGVPTERLQVTGYATNGVKDAPVLASYDRFVATGPTDCANRWDNQLANSHNTPSAHFGCALTGNIAAQIANPRDLLAPAVMTPADNGRREVVLGKYRNGQVTSSAQDEQASGKVSGQQ
ncbi:MAG: CpaD family pilus assembly protein [Caulobacteraceae bacterium]